MGKNHLYFHEKAGKFIEPGKTQDKSQEISVSKVKKGKCIPVFCL